jgi:ATP-dependent DNA helicase RecG
LGKTLSGITKRLLRYHKTATVECTHRHGTKYGRPFASQQVYTGDVFKQIDDARDFVLSKVNRFVGLRTGSAAADTKYELPPDAVGEAITNACAHRDYNSNAAVEVRLLADRLEVWNPGALPGTLTLESLYRDHASVPNNPLLAEGLYLARYIERAGSGTLMMIDMCREAGLAQPMFELREGFFVTTLWRDWLTEEVLAGLDLNERQRKAVAFLKGHGRMSNADFQRVTGAIRKTAGRDLDDMVSKGIVEPRGRGRGAHYTLKRKRDNNGTIET